MGPISYLRNWNVSQRWNIKYLQMGNACFRTHYRAHIFNLNTRPFDMHIRTTPPPQMDAFHFKRAESNWNCLMWIHWWSLWGPVPLVVCWNKVWGLIAGCGLNSIQFEWGVYLTFESYLHQGNSETVEAFINSLENVYVLENVAKMFLIIINLIK